MTVAFWDLLSFLDGRFVEHFSDFLMYYAELLESLDVGSLVLICKTPLMDVDGIASTCAYSSSHECLCVLESWGMLSLVSRYGLLVLSGILLYFVHLPPLICYGCLACPPQAP